MVCDGHFLETFYSYGVHRLFISRFAHVISKNRHRHLEIFERELDNLNSFGADFWQHLLVRNANFGFPLHGARRNAGGSAHCSA